MNVSTWISERRGQLARRFSLRAADLIIWLIRARLVPDLGDLTLAGGLAMLGWVLYQLTPLLMETYTGLLLCLIGIIRSGIVRRRDR